MLVCLCICGTKKKSAMEITIYVLNALHKTVKAPTRMSLLLTLTPGCKLLYWSNVFFIVFFPSFCIMSNVTKTRTEKPTDCWCSGIFCLRHWLFL